MKSIKEILESPKYDSVIEIKGWVRTFRNNQFIALNDGSTNKTLQLVLALNKFDDNILKKITTGACIEAKGRLIQSQGSGQNCELELDEISILGTSDADSYPIQPKKHSLEFLRENAHLRFRTNIFGSVFRIRHNLTFAIHSFFNSKGFFNLHSPIITASDAEGAGEMFSVSSLDMNKLPRFENGDVDFTKDFFGKKSHLSVSGQLQAELAAMGLGKVYTFGPTFRAENSNTARHLAEFWMIEPEVAFNNLDDNMDLAEEMLKYCIKYILEYSKDDLELLNQRQIDEDKAKPEKDRNPLNLLDKLNFCIQNDYQRLTYSEAIDILINCPLNKKGKFQYPITGFGVDLQSEHERYLVEKHFKKPVILINYPKEIKAFYMRLNDDGKTVAAMDILFPGIGEMIGGSQREERYDILINKMKDFNIPIDEMKWYLDSRKFGTFPHAGFGLGFERFVMFLTGMSNIRDVIPFPRTPKNCEF